MKPTASKRLFSLLLAVVMVFGLLPAVALPASAQHITGQINASGITPNEGLILEGDTTLEMDTDLAVDYIRGDYDLVIQGTGALTVYSDGAGIEVWQLDCYSDLTVQTKGPAIDVQDTLYIENNYTFIAGGGVYADMGVTIHCNNATIGGDTYGIRSTYEDITLNGVFDIGALEHALVADHGSVILDGTVNCNSVDSLSYCVEAYNNITTNTTVDLKVTGGSGMIARHGSVVLMGDNIYVEAAAGGAIVSEESFVSISANTLGALSMGGNPEKATNPYGISAKERVYAYVEKQAGIAGADYGIYAETGDIVLEGGGNFVIGAAGGKKGDCIGIFAPGGYINMTGSFQVESDLGQTIVAGGELNITGNLDATSEEEYDADVPFSERATKSVQAASFTFNGESLRVKGQGGIGAETGDVLIGANEVAISAYSYYGILANNVHIEAGYLWVESYNQATDLSTDYSGIAARQSTYIDADVGTIRGATGIDSLYETSLGGELTIEGIEASGVKTGEMKGTGRLNITGKEKGIDAVAVYFDGIQMDVYGQAGIYATYEVVLAGNVNITATGERNSGICSANSYVYLQGNIVIDTNGWYGIYTATDLTMNEGYYKITGPSGNAQAVKLGGDLYMDAELQIMEPTYGHVNGNEIYGAGDSPAMELEIYTPIEEVSLYINTPSSGEQPAWSAEGIYGLDTRCTVDKVEWFEDGEQIFFGSTFTAGKRYTVQITISADGDYRFNADLWGRINGEQVSTYMTQQREIVLKADLGTCPTTITNVAMTVTAPVEGNTPSTYVTDNNTAYGVKSQDVQWLVSDDGVSYTSMAATDKFVGGKYYRITMDVKLAGNNYTFKVDASGVSVQPDVLAMVNSHLAKTTKAYDQDPSRVITVSYDFGKCNDYIIEEVTVVRVTAPVAGEKPTYTAAVEGTGYQLRTDYTRYEDDYYPWLDIEEADRKYYIVNGIGWYDMTASDWLHAKECFIPGHEYKLIAYLKTQDSFEFAHSKYYEPTVTATVNGNSAIASLTGSDCVYMQQVEYTFTCKRQEIYNVMVYLDTPQAGKTPADYPLTTAYPEYYVGDANYGFSGDGVYWFDSQGNILEADDRFVQGEKYRVEIKLIPTQLEGSSLCEFTYPVTAYVNGKEVVTKGDWDSVYASSATVYIYYTFTKGATAPAVQPEYLPGDVNGDGQVTNDDVVKLLWHCLFPEGNEIVGDGDLTGDNDITNDDVVKLLWHTLFPEQYPLG